MKKNKNWCQIGVKPQKTPKKGKNNKSQKRRKPSKIKALRKTSQRVHKIISTHLLTVLTISVILQLEQRKRDKEIRRLKENLLDILHTSRVQYLTS